MAAPRRASCAAAPRRQLAAATASDEATLRGVLREILPNVMLDVAMKPPS